MSTETTQNNQGIAATRPSGVKLILNSFGVSRENMDATSNGSGNPMNNATTATAMFPRMNPSFCSVPSRSAHTAA
eukprot:12197212-Prorocentrum_lima.AAC.1